MNGTAAMNATWVFTEINSCSVRDVEDGGRTRDGVREHGGILENTSRSHKVE